jgi:hypothetical protein
MSSSTQNREHPGVALGRALASHVEQGGSIWIEPTPGRNRRGLVAVPTAAPTEPTGEAEPPAEHYVDASELAAEWDLTATQLSALLRQPDFPSPRSTTTAGEPLWSLDGLWEWRTS